MAADPGTILIYKNDGSGETTSVIDIVPFINNIESNEYGVGTLDWTREGYNFIEWNTSADGTGYSYFPGDSLDSFSLHNLELYAMWEEIVQIPPSVQPVLTYNLTWGTGNVFQKLSGKTYVNPNGQTVDCSSVSVTFSSSKHFKKFYATAVKSGSNYGFENDVLVDLTTGILLYELTERDANVNFSFTINTSSLTSGDGEYRIGLYVQNDDGFWNYEYFLLEANNLQLEESNNLLLQVPVQTSDEEPDCGFIVNGNTLTITDNSKLSDGLINNNDYLMVGCAFQNEEEEEQFFSPIFESFGVSMGVSINFKKLNEICHDGITDQQGNYISFSIDNIPLAICLTDGSNYYYIPLNENLFNNIMWGELFDGESGIYHYIPIIHKNYILGTNDILNNIELYGMGYDCDYWNPDEDIMYLSYLGNIADSSSFFIKMYLNDYFENRVINGVYPIISDVNFKYPPLE